MRASHQPQPSCERNQALRGMRGRESQRALQFVADNSHPLWKPNSPCSFALKEQWAASDLPFPKLTYPIEPTSAARGRRPTKQRYVPRPLLAKTQNRCRIRRDSYHASSDGIASDAQRRNALQLMGVTVITVTRGQLYNAASFDRTARTIATSIGVRLPKTSQRWISQNQMLRYVLLKTKQNRAKREFDIGTTG